MTIGEHIRKYCDDNYITRWEFANKVNMTNVGLSRIITENRLPNIPYIKNIAKALGITYMELIIDHYKTFEDEE
jgi:transcriptional regulator with XRE-family HTH domain